MRTWLREKVPASCLAGFGASPNLLSIEPNLVSCSGSDPPAAAGARVADLRKGHGREGRGAQT